jgi:hypothetical protein
VKTYASDEGRCIKTAAAFLKGFLSIEGELAPIISSMVMADSKAQSKLTSIKGFSIAPVRKIIRLWLMSYRNGWLRC